VEAVLVALERLIQGVGNLSHLEAAIRQTLAQSPASQPAVFEAIELAHRMGRLPDRAYQHLTQLLSGTQPGETLPDGLTIVRAPRAARAQPVQQLATASPVTASQRPVTRTQPPSEAPGLAAGGDQWLEEVDVGAVLVGRYRLDRKLGEGGMGVVYLAHDLVEQEFSERPYVAVKVLRASFRQHPDSLKALHEEVQKSRSLAHPNIVGVYTFHRDETGVFMTMEYLEGETVADRLRRGFAHGASFEEAWPIIEGVGRALTYAHEKNVVHSDLKPSNVFLTRDGVTKVLDFGIARAAGGGKATNSFDARALEALTPSYASCEMLEGQPPDPRDDIYALACVAYQLLTGKHPYAMAPAVMARDSGMKLSPVPGLTRRQNAALAAALDFRRGKRTPSVEAFVRGLHPAQPLSARRKAAYAALTVGAIALLVVVSWFSVRLSGGAGDDAAFVESLLRPGTAVTASNTEIAATLLEQGNDYLRQAQEHFDPGLLSQGVSTAYGAFQGVLKLDPANRKAAEGILNVLRLYREQAHKEFDAGHVPEAAELVEIGLTIHPGSRELQELRSEIEARNASSSQ